MREKIQQLGGFLAGMVIPNIGAFIAWGLITALFIPTGWIPNETFAKLVGPMITYLLPLLIGYTGGKMVHGVRGGVVGAAATMGVIVGASIPMFLGGMIMGPLGGWLMKKIDEMLEGKIPVGFEMLINNFSAGILITGPGPGGQRRHRPGRQRRQQRAPAPSSTSWSRTACCPWPPSSSSPPRSCS